MPKPTPKFCPTCNQPIGPSEIDPIINAVCTVWGVTRADMLGPRRLPSIVEPRHATIFLARELSGLSFPSIARWMGLQDHTSARHAYFKVRTWAPSTTDEEADQQFRRLEAARALSGLEHYTPLAESSE